MQDSRESRLAVLEERARRARRRLVLTLVLLVATAAAWAAVAAALLVWWAALVPTALLGVVLVLGRLAAVSARRADERRAAERRAAERQAAQARSLAAGGPRAPRNRARVTGVAVRGDDSSTQMIPRVARAGAQQRRAATAPSDGERDGERGGEQPDPAPADGAPDVAGPKVVDGAVAAEDAAAAQGSGAAAEAATSAPEVTEGGASWDPRPVPLPTYVTKPAAPRREPRPLTDATPVVASTGWATRPRQRAEALGGLRAHEGTRDGEPAAAGAVTVIEVIEPVATIEATEEAAAGAATGATVAEEAQPSTETLGLPLEQILARRRAAG